MTPYNIKASQPIKDFVHSSKGSAEIYQVTNIAKFQRLIGSYATRAQVKLKCESFRGVSSIDDNTVYRFVIVTIL